MVEGAEQAGKPGRCQWGKWGGDFFLGRWTASAGASLAGFGLNRGGGAVFFAG
jgi:hypothetical protein